MLIINKISKTFNEGTPNEKKALNNISLKINEKDFITIIGGNGAGKSTLLNCVAGTYIVDTGRIRIDNIDVTTKPEYFRAKYIGRVFQDTKMGTAGNMSIEQNLAMAKRRGEKLSLRLGLPKNDSPKYKKYIEVLDLGLENRLRDMTGLLSGGQRQALTLVMATIKKPRLLLLDEHTAALDPKTAKKVLELTEKLIKEEELTAIMITHNMKDALKYGNRLIMMDKGEIIYDINEDEKKNLTIPDLLKMFESKSGDDAVSDRMLLS